MSNLQFQSFHPGLDPETVVMIDGYAPGYRMISHWPGHSTPEVLRHDITTGSAFLYNALSNIERRELIGDFSIVTNNHYDTDGAMSLYTMLYPEVAAQYQDLMLRTAGAGDLALWGGTDALALELSVMCDLGPFMPFTTPPHDNERLGNLASAYQRLFERLESMLENPFKLEHEWADRHCQVTEDVERVQQGIGVQTTKYTEDDLAVVVSDRPITIYGLRQAAGDLFRVLLIHPGGGGNRYRFCFRGESWWDVVSAQPLPRKPLTELATRLNTMENESDRLWWASPPDWTVPELGFGEPVTFRHQAVRFDPLTEADPCSSLPVETVVEELRNTLKSAPLFNPVAITATPELPD